MLYYYELVLASETEVISQGFEYRWVNLKRSSNHKCQSMRVTKFYRIYPQNEGFGIELDEVYQKKKSLYKKRDALMTSLQVNLTVQNSNHLVTELKLLADVRTM